MVCLALAAHTSELQELTVLNILSLLFISSLSCVSQLEVGAFLPDKNPPLC